MIKSEIFSASLAALRISFGSFFKTSTQLFIYALWLSAILGSMPNCIQSMALAISALSSSLAYPGEPNFPVNGLSNLDL